MAENMYRQCKWLYQTQESLCFSFKVSWLNAMHGCYERQGLPCEYLVQHELNSDKIVTIGVPYSFFLFPSILNEQHCRVHARY